MPKITVGEGDGLVAAVQQALGDRLGQATLATGKLPGPLAACLRRDGKRLEEVWVETGDINQAIASIQARAGARAASSCTLDFTQNWLNVPLDRAPDVLTNKTRGLSGFELQLGARRVRVPPTLQIATNRSFARFLERFLKHHKLDPAEFEKRGQLRVFDAVQVFIASFDPPSAKLLHRGGGLVAPETMDRAEFDLLIDGMKSWMKSNIRPSGHLVYKYWPSRGEETKADNTIRRFMGTLALIRSGFLEEAARNIDFNLNRFYRVENGLGLIDWEGKVKLGAVALAALAILEHPEKARWSQAYQSLCRTTDYLHQADGSFRTFLKPSDRNDNQNFYPGEALLFWAQRLRLDPADGLADRFTASFQFYRSWHRKARNPAFVPWHSMAYAAIADLPDRDAMHDFVIEMNDWLLDVQQWGPPLAPEFWGRFYAPDRPEFGPPHASSTGVYLEGLAAALALAQDANDLARAARYEAAIWRAARNLRQLQFREPEELFYIAHPERVLGGLRTEVYNNEIRVDNIQHGLMGLLNARPRLRAETLLDAQAAEARAAGSISG